MKPSADQLRSEIADLQRKRALQQRNLDTTDRELAARKAELAKLTRKETHAHQH